jgi:hypothetical protein
MNRFYRKNVLDSGIGTLVLELPMGGLASVSPDFSRIVYTSFVPET